MMSDSKDVSCLRQERDELQEVMDHVSHSYEHLEETLTFLRKSGSVYEQFEDMERSHLEIIRNIVDCIRDLEVECGSGYSARSRGSRRSSRSSTNSKWAESAAGAVGLGTKMEHIDTYSKAKLELEKKKYELKHVKKSRELNIAEARLKAIIEAEAGCKCSH